MSLEDVERFLLLCLLVNAGLYTLTAVAVLVMRGFVNRVHRRMFGVSEDASNRAIVAYLSAYKLLITVFLFAPWFVLAVLW